MQLSIRHIVAGWLVMISLVVAAAGLAFRYYAEAMESKWQRDIQAVATASQRHIEWLIADHFKDADALARRASVWQSMEGPAGPIKPGFVDERLKLAVQQALEIYGYKSISVYDRDLMEVVPRSREPLSALELEALRDVLQTQRRVLVDMHVASDGVPAFGVAQPLFSQGDPGRALVGVVYLEINATTGLYPSLARWPTVSDTAEAALLRREGDEAVYLSPLRFAPDAPPLSIRRSVNDREYAAAAAVRSNAPGMVKGLDYRGTEVIGAAVPVDGTSWFIVVKNDRADLVASADRLKLTLAAGAVFLAGLLGLGAKLLWRARQARDQTERLALDARYAAARNSSIDGYVVIDHEGRIVEVNPALQRMTGYTADELLSMSVHELNTEMSADQIGRNMAQLRQHGSLLFRARWRRKDGQALDLQISATYLASGQGGTYQGFLRDTGPELRDMRRIQRLQTFYVFLSHVNAAIFTSKKREDVLAAVCQGAVRDGGFLLTWAGVLDERRECVVPLASYGAASDYVRHLIITTNPELPTSQGPSRLSMVHGTIEYTDDFQADPRTQPWHALGREHGIHASAAVPVMVDGEALAVLTFYAGEKAFFDTEMRMLLEEAARSVSLALQAIEARKARQDSEERFARVFDASPVPMQIVSYTTHRFRSMNKAMSRVFGYTLAELPDEDAWFELAYPDPVLRDQVRTFWYTQHLPAARTGGPQTVITSPELALRCRDGSERIARGFMTVVGDDIVIQWEDLTDIKHAEEQLAQDEQRFQGLIEQALIGIYVAQDNRIAYANPRFCDIVGYPRDQVIGQDALAFIANSDEARRKVLGERERMRSGQKGELLTVPFQTGQGRTITLGLQANLAQWNGRPAIVVMGQDITERQHAQERIADYVRQLEGTMQGTLTAVANMVDQRDPYTAGHARRVGIIAADIAREMGWDETRCHNLKLIGLVHDIGKISVPSEILAKPTRLTPLEYEIIKLHAEKGYEILKDLEFPLPIAEIIREHHERMDGSGYPQGLRGDAILPEARILAVADVLESMASHRPYRPALGLEAAVKEIEDHRGSGFDSTVVDAALRLIRERGYTLPR